MLAVLSINLVNHFLLAVIYASVLIMFVIGLNMTYSVLKFSNFAHAEFVTLGMYLGWWSLQAMAFLIPGDAGNLLNNIFFHATFAFIGVGVFGIICDVLVFERMRNIRANPTTFTVGSIGIGLVARFIFGMIWGELPTLGANYSSIPVFPAIPNIPIISDLWTLLTDRRISIPIIDLPIGKQSINITNFDLWIVIFAFIFVFGVDYFFKHTKLGIAMRATSDSHDLAQVSGIDTKRIIYYTWFIAAGITGFAGAWVRAKQNNFSNIDGAEVYLLPIFAVAILGGVGSFKGGIIAAFILGFSRQITIILFTIFQNSSGIFPLEDWLNIVTFAPAYKDGVGFIILIVVLLYRPQGIAGSVEATRARV
jgi:branched-subunit amino acid ABC-type transport system permease component